MKGKFVTAFLNTGSRGKASLSVESAAEQFAKDLHVPYVLDIRKDSATGQYSFALDQSPRLQVRRRRHWNLSKMASQDQIFVQLQDDRPVALLQVTAHGIHIWELSSEMASVMELMVKAWAPSALATKGARRAGIPTHHSSEEPDEADALANFKANLTVPDIWISDEGGTNSRALTTEDVDGHGMIKRATS